MTTLAEISSRLAEELDAMSFSSPITHVYNPSVYARAPYDEYVRRYGTGPKEAVFVGMNPGPWGMMQTGIPFGEVELCRDWLGVSGPVEQPPKLHPKRPVTGFSTTRREVSGKRVWTWAKERFGKPEAFFSRFWVLNYCPLGFFDERGRNVTPDKVKVNERRPLIAACDQALRQTVQLLQAPLVIGIGRFAEDRAKAALGELDVEVGRILHPSPASPAANRGWAPQAEAQLAELGILF